MFTLERYLFHLSQYLYAGSSASRFTPWSAGSKTACPASSRRTSSAPCSPPSAAPKNSIDESNRAFTFNQRAKRKISPGDYILYSDIELDQSKSHALGDGQWGVTVTFADAVLTKMLQPGDDIAIIGTFVYQDSIRTEKNEDAEAKVVSKTVTAVIYPRVSILEIQGGSVLLSLPPEQAIAMTAIQRKAQLFPILRKKKDDNALSRMDGGMFEDSALVNMLQGLQKIEIPLVPSEVKQ